MREELRTGSVNVPGLCERFYAHAALCFSISSRIAVASVENYLHE